MVKWRGYGVLRVKEVKVLKLKALEGSLEQILPSVHAPPFYWEEASCAGSRLAK